MRSISLRRPVALGITAIVLLTGLSLAPVGAAVAEDGATPAPTPSSEPTAAPEATETPESRPSPEPSLSPEPTEPTGSPEPTSSPAPIESSEPTQTLEPTQTPEPVLAPEPTPTSAPSKESVPAPKPGEESDPPLAEMQASRFMMSRTAGVAFEAGNIISDANMFDRWAMTEAEIQGFLERKIAEVGGCTSSDCLAVLKVDTFNKTWSDTECAPYAGAKGESAARVIYKVQSACGVSAKALLVLMQKEQGLLTTRDPSDYQLRAATGAGCPDTPGGCTNALAGFFYQVYAAADLLTWYGKPSSGLTHYPVGKVSQISYQANMPSCGTSGVLVQNRATAALYYYTPYQPNAAALANMYGTGDACSAYGNRNFWRYYNDWFGDPTGVPATRIAGKDRYETAAAISRSSFGSGSAVPVVYVATGLNFPDALSAAPAAAAQGGPMLLVRGDSVPAPTMTELKRLKPKRIVLVGSAGIIDDGVKRALAGVAPVERLAGADRYETSRKIMEKVFPAVTSAYVATGNDYPDALAASAAAGAKKVPVLLVPGTADRADAETIASLRKVGVKSVKVAGGPTIVTPAILDSFAKAGVTSTRLSGVNRYLTAVAINKDAFPNAKVAYIATGASFPDALAGAAAAARENSPLYLTASSCVKPEVRADINARGVTFLKLLGSSGVLSESIARLAVC